MATSILKHSWGQWILYSSASQVMCCVSGACIVVSICNCSRVHWVATEMSGTRTKKKPRFEQINHQTLETLEVMRWARESIEVAIAAKASQHTHTQKSTQPCLNSFFFGGFLANSLGDCRPQGLVCIPNVGITCTKTPHVSRGVGGRSASFRPKWQQSVGYAIRSEL